MSLGWDDHFAAAFEPFVFTHTVARVARVDRGMVDCLTAAGAIRVRIRFGAEPPVTGDWVAVVEDDAGWWLDGTLPRRTAITRAAASGRSDAQVLAANVDVVFVAVPAFPEPRPGVVERLLTLAWTSGATPVVVVTKCDLSHGAAALVAEVAENAPGVEVVGVSSLTGEGIDELRSYVADGRTACLLGPSGVGKSTLVNALVGAEVLETDRVRRDGKGRHTTTRRELIALPSGGALLDTTGLRGAGLWSDEEAIERTFADVEELAAQCRFGDCAHVTEPDCAVLAAIDTGQLPGRRLEAWRKLRREAQWMAARADARLLAERRRAWKVLSVETRRAGRSRP